MNDMQTQELISALADGQLQGEALARGLELALSDSVARQAWHSYHLIGDVLRSGQIAAGSAPTAFLERLQGQLRSEQRQLQVAAVAAESPPVRALASQRPAANDDIFRWKLVAGLASVAAVAAIAWTVIGGGGKPEQAQLAGAQSGTVLTSGERGVMIRDPRLDEFLDAHRQLGGASALQMPAGFLRNATFEAANR